MWALNPNQKRSHKSSSRKKKKKKSSSRKRFDMYKREGKRLQRQRLE